MARTRFRVPTASCVCLIEELQKRKAGAWGACTLFVRQKNGNGNVVGSAMTNDVECGGFGVGLGSSVVQSVGALIRMP